MCVDRLESPNDGFESNQETDMEYDVTQEEQQQNDAPLESQSIEEQLRQTKQQIEDLKKEIEILTLSKFGITKASHDPELVRNFTGYQSPDVFDFNLWLEPYAKNMMTRWQVPRNQG